MLKGKKIWNSMFNLRFLKYLWFLPDKTPPLFETFFIKKFKRKIAHQILCFFSISLSVSSNSLSISAVYRIWSDQLNRFLPLWGRLYHKNLPPLLRSSYKTWHTQSSGTDNFGDFQGSNPISSSTLFWTMIAMEKISCKNICFEC